MKNDNKDVRKGVARAKFFFSFAATVLGVPVTLARNFHFKPFMVKEKTFIMMSNHADNYDPVYSVLLTGRHMRFVMSDHLTRKKLYRFLFSFLASPIVYRREKGSDELYDEIVKNCRAGVSVGIYVEGGKSDNGETGFVSHRNAELVRDCGCALVTCRLKGGYLKAPRWADNERKGPIFGEIVNIYTKEELERMSLEEIYSHIISDIYVNAYEEQRKNPYRYTADNPAQSAEIILYVCPKCEQIGTLKSSGNEIRCECGFSAETDDYGFWHSRDMPFDDIVCWDKFQRKMMKKLADESRGTDTFLFRDDEQIVYVLENGNRVLLGNEGEVSLYADRLELSYENEKLCIPLAKIIRVGTASKMNLFIITDENYYEIRSSKVRSAIKYKVAIRYLQGKGND
ncbi:MAG: 1-acyl-sn-glycerol-3-phosphate acyltransferase [Clostridia bacterium]|nr:1-acyl-sn-glycerol-3-phosphate acyltransferase [Clostridia bacterium]